MSERDYEKEADFEKLGALRLMDPKDQDAYADLLRYKQYALSRRFITREMLDDAEKYYHAISPKNERMADMFVYQYLLAQTPGKKTEVDKK